MKVDRITHSRDMVIRHFPRWQAATSWIWSNQKQIHSIRCSLELPVNETRNRSDDPLQRYRHLKFEYSTVSCFENNEGDVKLQIWSRELTAPTLCQSGALSGCGHLARPKI